VALEMKSMDKLVDYMAYQEYDFFFQYSNIIFEAFSLFFQELQPARLHFLSGCCIKVWLCMCILQLLAMLMKALSEVSSQDYLGFEEGFLLLECS